MSVLLMGINHNTAPIEVRESISFDAQSIVQELSSLQKHANLSEVAIINTCNRTEIYYDVPCQCKENTAQTLCHGVCTQLETVKAKIIHYLNERSQLPQGTVEPFLYEYQNDSMVRHAMRVASGLNSMALGEPQILGQMKQSYQHAIEAGTLKKVMLRLFQSVFSSAKQVRSETAIGSESISIAAISVKLVAQFYTSLENKKVILIGAGDTIRLVAQHITGLGSNDFLVANRNVDNALALVQNDVTRVIALEQLEQHLSQTDIIISSTASSQRIITAQQIKQVMAQRPNRRLLLIDLAVPRDIEPAVEQIPQVYLYSIDNLMHIAQSALSRRQSKVLEAERIIAQHEQQFMQWLNVHNSAELIQALRQKAQLSQDEIIQKYLTKIHHGEEPEQCLKQLSLQLTNKLLHAPTVALREAIEEKDIATINVIKNVYDI